MRHRPDLGYTVQLNAPALLAERTGIAVVADFRTRDVAAGGQGAPLVPAFHAAIFAADVPRARAEPGRHRQRYACSRPDEPVRGFDTGPPNMLLDEWCRRHTGQHYDHDGAFAAAGKVDTNILEYLLASEPWLAKRPPKSTGRDLFNATWLDSRLNAWDGYCRRLTPQDIQATLQRFTARTVAQAIDREALGHAGDPGVRRRRAQQRIDAGPGRMPEPACRRPRMPMAFPRNPWRRWPLPGLPTPM